MKNNDRWVFIKYILDVRIKNGKKEKEKIART